MLCKATQDGGVMVESSDKTWSTGGGKGNSFWYSCHEILMDSMKRQKDRTPTMSCPGWKVFSMLLGGVEGNYY